MRTLKIDLSELESAFESGDDFLVTYFLDLETGKTVLVTQEVHAHALRIAEDYYNEETDTVDWESAFKEERIPDWEQESIQEAMQVEEDSDGHFIAIPSQSSSEGYHDMQAFITTVRNPSLQERLERAIRGRGAFRYFKDVLRDYPKERERWFQFEQDQLHQRMLDWLESEGIAPV